MVRCKISSIHRITDWESCRLFCISRSGGKLPSQVLSLPCSLGLKGFRLKGFGLRGLGFKGLGFKGFGVKDPRTSKTC